MDLPVRKLFDPSVMPPRDSEGMCCHTDLLSDRWNMDDNEEAYDRAKFAAAGYEISFVDFECDATEKQLQRYEDEGGPDCLFWTPSTPPGGGWVFCGIWDTEDGPMAFYVRELVAKS